MVREITSVTAGVSVPAVPNAHAKVTKTPQKLPVLKTGLSKSYTSENLKANFLTFTGTQPHNKVAQSLSFKGSNYELSTIYDAEPSYRTNVTETPTYKKYRTPFYESTANDLAISLGPDKNVILAHDKDVTPELLIHKFSDNIQKGKYKNTGLSPYDTQVFIVDTKEAAKKGLLPHEAVNQIMTKDVRSNKVIFVTDLTAMVQGLLDKGITPTSYLKQGNLKNTHVIGMIDKNMLKPKSQEELMVGESFLKPKFIEGLPRVDFDGLGSKDAKELLKTDHRFTSSVLKRYQDVHVKVTDSAIDALVDGAVTKSDAAFPNKALNVLDLAVSAKLNEMHSKKTYLTNATLTAPDVKRFFDNHSDLLAGMKKSSGQFQLAENVKTRLSDVGGIKDVKENIQEGILAYIKDPKKFLATGQKAPKGILMHGEPGTGKTLIARAIAGEAGVPFIAASGSEFVEKYVGVGAQRVRELFDTAKKAAAQSEKKTAIIFIDEIDAIGKQRKGEGGGSDETEKTLNQLLTEMDGFSNKESKVRVIVMAATNRADILDPALKRAGRFDDILEVPAPSRNVEARQEILAIHAKGKPFANEIEKAKIIKEASQMTAGMSGAELAEIMTKAAKIVAKRSDNKVITHNDVVEGFLQVAVGPMKKSDLTADDKKMVVRHEGGHAVVLDTLKNQDISFITLDERGEFLGAVFHQKPKDMPNFKSVIASVATSYAGGLAEPRYDSMGHGAGVSGDLENATKTIQAAVTKWGLGVHTPQLSLDEKSPFMGTYAKEVKKDMELFSNTGHKVAKMIVEFHKDFLDDYVKKYEANAGKGGNNLSGEQFSILREKWLKDTGKEKEFLKLQNKITQTIKIAQNSKKGINKLLFKLI
ncbi:MAG: AAA family ATPase [Candidatus Gastranaerophilales bacterium]|nr:AAA family ATPase [Candidatus Gastranaerophilales bacterium]